MLFNLHAILAVVSSLTSTAFATANANETAAELRGCFPGGEKWTDLGTVSQIYAALEYNACLRGKKTGDYVVGQFVGTA